jgi:hypothetical protein
MPTGAGANNANAGTMMSGNVISSVERKPLREESIPATPVSQTVCRQFGRLC